MNATKFVVLLIFVGVVCSNVGARQLEEVSKETKLGISIPKTVTTNGLGAELNSVTVSTSATNSESSDADADAGKGGPSSDASGRVNKSTSGYVRAEGPNASASSKSYAAGSTSSGAAAGPNGAGSGASSDGVAYSSGEGSVSP